VLFIPGLLPLGTPRFSEILYLYPGTQGQASHCSNVLGRVPAFVALIEEGVFIHGEDVLVILGIVLFKEGKIGVCELVFGGRIEGCFVYLLVY